jgi:hypothetical protein
MPTVPWIRLYHNWPRHRKTMALRRLLGTAEPILCLWLWAAENAPDGYLGAMSQDDLESAAEWRGERGKAASALMESGFIDINGNGTMTLHNWEARTGAGVSNLLKTRERQRELMRNKRANVSANSDAKNSETLLLSSGSEKNGSGESKSKSECANVSANNFTASRLIHRIKVAVERQPNAKVWAAEPMAPKNADEFLRSLGDVEKALPDIEKRIDLFAADPDMQPWTVRKFCEKYNGIGLAKLEFGRSPDSKPKKMQARY